MESLQKVGLKNISFDFLLIGFLTFFLITLFLSFKIWLTRKKDQIESESLSVQKKQPFASWFGLMGFITLSGIFLFLAVLKWSDLSVMKAIIAVDNTSVQTATGGHQATIYDASIGLEVDILKIDSDFVQIRYPGAFSGWVAKKNLEILSRPAWP